MPHSNDQDKPVVEAACLDDLPALTDLVMGLLSQSDDFVADQFTQEHGLRLILEQPSRGRIFIIRNNDQIFGMVNLLFTISTACGGFVILMEDVIVHPNHRGHGYGTMLLEHVIAFGKQKQFRRITLLTDRDIENSRKFFQRHGFETSNMVPMRKLL